MWGFQRAAGAAVWTVLVTVRWLHSQLVAAPAQWWLDNVLGTAEESAKAFAREAFSMAGRLVNGVATWMVSILLGRRYYTRMEPGQRRSRAWHAWHTNPRASTLNAVAEQAGLIDARPRSPPPRRRRSSAAAADSRGRLQRRAAAAAAYLRSCLALPFGGGGGGTAAAPPGGAGMKRSGSDLFDRPSGYAVAERLHRRGLAERARVGVEVAIETVFDAIRAAVRAALRLRPRPPPAGLLAGAGEDWARARRPSGAHGLRRAQSFGSWEDAGAWTASDVILQAGYPLEEHVVTTSDGYVLSMQRLPRKDSREAVFFQHGILDTSLG
jgi:lysosomal acid lipase/cholesteryl ester hydrolase